MNRRTRKSYDPGNQYQRIVPFIIFILALFIFYKLIQPMLTILLSSAIIAYISFPLHKRISKKVANKSISIFLSLSIIVIIILIPFSFLVFEITRQGYYFYDSLSDKIDKGALFGFGCTSEDSKVCALVNQAERFSLERLSQFGLDRRLRDLIPVIEGKITDFILGIPLILAQIFITLVIAYFIMKEWELIMMRIVGILPMRGETIKRLIHEFGNITYTVIFGQLFVAIVQGILGSIGFYLLGVPFPIFFGVLLAFCALIPTIGTAIIWFPASLYLILSGYFSHDYWILGKGVGLFLYGLLIISTIDNILLAKIVHSRARVSQIIVIMGVIGGASLFGIPGIFIGPILLPLLITYFETFKERFLDMD